ncbi:hypothetical protein WICPIJ_006226 [Wickerhamomyces pijperi]|uniref:Dopey N-terminal domain-containing protein n=1 Tax=Wickerhamomyces pijperi TaxID=599730 RepID=A0A9P8Q443_WICPI|nr:hypothetical protein WICPIJ_006226 [Wickerhamomyces pijperi]
MSTEMDSKDKKYQQGIERALSSFDSVEEWADYIAFLSKLLKSLQQKHTSTQWVPIPLQISIKLSKCLLPDLPSGVHQKTLEIYNFIFTELGVLNLSKQANIWIPGILPIMQFAAISIKPTVIKIYKEYLLNMPSSTLKSIVKPLLSYLLLSIDDERSEFFEASLKLIDDLKTALADDSLFWQSVFLIMITSEERRLGCLVWCNKRFPDLNAVVEVNKDDESLNNSAYYKLQLQKQFNSDQMAVITPEPGLLVRAFQHCLRSNSLLIQRGFFDLLIKKFQLNCTILQHLTPHQDLQDLMVSCVSAVLKKDMSINRRVWNWFLGPDQESSSNVKYFKEFGIAGLSSGLLKLIEGKYYESSAHEQKISSFKILLAILDKWEIGSEIMPLVFLPFLRSVRQSVEDKSYMHDEVLRSASGLFDSVETITIYSNIYKLIENNDADFVIFILQNFNCHDEEMVIHQFPLLFISTAIKLRALQLEATVTSAAAVEEKFLEILLLVSRHIPERAFLPIEHSDEQATDSTDAELLSRISGYYEEGDVSKLPLKLTELSKITLDLVSSLAFHSLQATANLSQYVKLLNRTIDIIPELQFQNDALFEVLKTQKFQGSSIIDASSLYQRLNFVSPFDKLEILKVLITQLLDLLKSEEADLYQVEVTKCLQSLTVSSSRHHVEGGITRYLLALPDFDTRLSVFDYLWKHTTDVQILDRPLAVVLDEAFKFSPLSLKSWILGNMDSIEKLFVLLVSKLPVSLQDTNVFTYQIELIYNVLTQFDQRRLIQAFKTTVQNEETRITFRDYTVTQLKKYLDLQEYDIRTFRVVFRMFETLFDGIESSFEDHITSCFFLTDDFISNSASHPEYESICMILLDHLGEVTKFLINKHTKVSSILINSNDEKSYPFIIGFLLKGFDKFNTPALLGALIKLLSVSLKFQDEFIFEYIEPIIFSILDKIESSNSHSGNLAMLSLLLGTSEEVLSLFRTYVVTLEINDNKNIHNDPGFFSSVVSGVIPEALKRNENGEVDGSIAVKRAVLTKCLERAIALSLNIWNESDSYLKAGHQLATSSSSSLRYQSIQLKLSSRTLLESLYSLEPLETMRCMIKLSVQDGQQQQQSIIRLLHVLEKTRPQLTIPNIFALLRDSIQQNISSGDVIPSSLQISEFMIEYMSSLQDDSMEDIYAVTSQFLKDFSLGSLVSSSGDVYSFSNSVNVNILRFIAIFNQKLSHSKFYEDRKVKRDVADYFSKILPICLNGIKVQYKTESSESSAEIRKNGEYTNEEMYNHVSFISSEIKSIIPESDKQHSLISSILTHLISPIFKSGKNFPALTKPYQLDLLSSLVQQYPTSRSVRLLTNDAFSDPLFFSAQINDLTYWNSIIVNQVSNTTALTATASDPNEKINDLLTKLTQSSGANIFNWNENEQLFKAAQLKRVSYLMAVDTKDRYIAILKDLFKKLDSLSSLDSILADIFLAIRVVLLKVSPIHLYGFWTFIYTVLQEYFVKVLNSVKVEDVNLRTLLHACKLLDVILVLKFEDFQEWIFIIDTIDAIYRKNDTIFSLIDEISANTKLFSLDAVTEEKSLLSRIDKNLRKPGLLGVTSIGNINQLHQFFNGLSYYNYENTYNGGEVAYDACEEDLFQDLFEKSK